MAGIGPFAIPAAQRGCTVSFSLLVPQCCMVIAEPAHRFHWCMQPSGVCCRQWCELREIKRGTQIVCLCECACALHVSVCVSVYVFSSYVSCVSVIFLRVYCLWVCMSVCAFSPLSFMCFSHDLVRNKVPHECLLLLCCLGTCHISCACSCHGTSRHLVLQGACDTVGSCK